MQKRHNYLGGFTIVELLIVIVIIAILAAISLVAYNGVQARTRASSLVADVNQIVKSLENTKTTAGDSQYPADLSGLNLSTSADNTINYYYNSQAKTYCVSSTNGTQVYSASSSDKTPVQGSCARSGMAAWWTFNGNANDTGRTGTNGTVSNVTSVAGQNGAANGAYSFNGTNSAINFNNPTAGTGIKLPTPLTVSVWVNHTGTGATGNIFSADQYGCGGSTFNYYGYNVSIGPTNAMSVNTGSGSGCSGTNRYSRSTAANSITPNQWVHLTAVFESSSSIMLYVNGVESGGGYSGTVRQMAYTNNLSSRIGMKLDGIDKYSGQLDDLRIYDRGLTAAEALQLYNEGAQ